MSKKFSMFLVILFVFSSSFVLLSINVNAASQTITTNQTGTHEGFFYSFWNQGGGGAVTMTLGDKGNYGVTWSSCTNFTCGKGWKIGSARDVKYSGTFNGGNNGYLALYGWTKNELIEYYVIESYGQWTPPGGQSIGTMTSDGGTYNIVKMRRENQPSIIGTASFDQFFSVRTSKRSSGTITFSNHINAWKSKNLNLGTTWDYLIMESEGYQSSGSANITVEGDGATATIPPTTSTPTISNTMPPPSSAIVYGDLNDDAKVTSSDVSVATRYTLGSVTLSSNKIKAADVNLDGKVTSTDVSIIERYTLGSVTRLPVN